MTFREKEGGKPGSSEKFLVNIPGLTLHYVTRIRARPLPGSRIFVDTGRGARYHENRQRRFRARERPAPVWETGKTKSRQTGGK
jgi:hypothetical protein